MKQEIFQLHDRVQIIANEDALLNGLTGYVAGFDGDYVSVAISAFDYTTYLMPASAIEVIAQPAIIDENGVAYQRAGKGHAC